MSDIPSQMRRFTYVDHVGRALLDSWADKIEQDEAEARAEIERLREARLDWIKGAMDFQIAQLRHAYTHLMNGTVGDQKAFAEGLIAPCIRRYEKLISELENEAAKKAGQL